MIIQGYGKQTQTPVLLCLWGNDMRFIHYLQPEDKNDINEVRAMRIRLIQTPEDYSGLIDEMSKKYNTSIDIYDTINELNNELKIMYKGKYTFALCIDEGVIPDKIKIRKKYLKKIKLMFFEADDTLAKLKREIENKAKEIHS